jgi:hypothetical protein
MIEPKRTAKDIWKLKFLVAYRGEQTMHVIHWSENVKKGMLQKYVTCCKVVNWTCSRFSQC